MAYPKHRRPHERPDTVNANAAERDAEILRSIKTLEKINGKKPVEFWKEADAK